MSENIQSYVGHATSNGLTLTENTIIDWSCTLVTYREFLTKTMGLELKAEHDLYAWLKTHMGKTLKEAFENYGKEQKRKNMNEILQEERFNMISESDKAFIMTFDDEMGKLGYDYGGNITWGTYWGKFMIAYSKTNVKNKKVIARIFIKDDEIVLKLILTNVDKHIIYIENAAAHIKNVFVDEQGACGCNPKKEGCRIRKTYTIDGRLIEKCSEHVFWFYQPTMKKLSDYMNLLAEFYQPKNSKRAK